MLQESGGRVQQWTHWLADGSENPARGIGQYQSRHKVPEIVVRLCSWDNEVERYVVGLCRIKRGELRLGIWYKSVASGLIRKKRNMVLC